VWVGAGAEAGGAEGAVRRDHHPADGGGGVHRHDPDVPHVPGPGPLLLARGALPSSRGNAWLECFDKFSWVNNDPLKEATLSNDHFGPLRAEPAYPSALHKSTPFTSPF